MCAFLTGCPSLLLAGLKLGRGRTFAQSQYPTLDEEFGHSLRAERVWWAVRVMKVPIRRHRASLLGRVLVIRLKGDRPLRERGWRYKGGCGERKNQGWCMLGSVQETSGLVFRDQMGL